MKPVEGQSWSPYAVNVKGLSDLEAGHDRGLDAICDGILHGREFIYPAVVGVAMVPMGLLPFGVVICSSRPGFPALGELVSNTDVVVAVRRPSSGSSK